MKKATLLALACLAGISHAAEKKRVIVCTVTTGFRHAGAIAEAEKTLPKLAKESGAFEIVEFVRQPDVAIPKRPNKPKDLKPDANDKDKARYGEDMKKFDAEMAKWTPGGGAGEGGEGGIRRRREEESGETFARAPALGKN